MILKKIFGMGHLIGAIAGLFYFFFDPGPGWCAFILANLALYRLEQQK